MMNGAASKTQNPKPETKVRDYLELVKFSHTIFALPFALASMIIAANGFPDWRVFAWILVAMISARTAAMGFNRIVDRDIDALNPRTQSREIPAGKVSVAHAAILVGVSALLFVFAAWQLNMLALILSPLALAALFFYSYCKRFTHFAHFVLGLCLGIAPVGAWVAVRGNLDFAPCVLAAAVMLWVAGFDVIYATMDNDFDRAHGIHSLVQTLGIGRALNAAKLLHVGFIALLGTFGILVHLSWPFFVGVLLIAAFLIFEHSLVDESDLRRVNAAFFTVNGVISVVFLAIVMASVWLPQIGK